MLDWRREQEQREMAANAKAVEILVRVRGLRQAQALSLVYDHLLSFNRLVVEQRTVIPWGHRPPCEEMADLLGRFPAHRAWTDGLPCGPGSARLAAVEPGTPPPPARDAGDPGVIVHAYFTDRPPAAAATLRAAEPATLPRAFATFDRSRHAQVTLFLGLRPRGRALRVVSRWHDESGAERRVLTRITQPPATEGIAWAWQTHTVAMWELRPYPGRWTATVWVDEIAAGEVSFTLER